MFIVHTGWLGSHNDGPGYEICSLVETKPEALVLARKIAMEHFTCGDENETVTVDEFGVRIEGTSAYGPFSITVYVDEIKVGEQACIYVPIDQD